MEPSQSSNAKMTFKERLKSIGPTAIIAGAIVGPGTVTTSTVIGVNYGYAFLWVLFIVVFFQLALHDMTTRLALVTGKTYQANIKDEVKNPILRTIIIAIVFIAIVLTGLSFMVGNLTGAGLALQFFVPTSTGNLAMLVGIVTAILVFTGSYKVVETAMKYMIIAFGLSFLFTAVIIGPNLLDVLKGLFTPSVPEGSWPTFLALVGTTGIGGYPLFLHTNAILNKWPGIENLKKARNDLFFMIPVAMITTAMIIISAASLYGSGIQVTSAAVMGQQLEPLYGPVAKYVFAIGLFAAGISSALASSMAVAWITTGLLGKNVTIKDNLFKAIVGAVLFLGALMAYLGTRPIQLIISAQAVNGFLGPITAIVLVWLTSNKLLMKGHQNNKLVTILGIVAITFSLIISARTLMSLF